MAKRYGLMCLLFAALSLAEISGCSRRPKPPERPVRTPQESAARALTRYDADGNGQLDAAELKKCPALAAGVTRIDLDRDGVVTAGEIEARIKYWETALTTIINGSTEVKLDGKPLAGATVTFEPEDFLGAAFIACSGQTDENGYTLISGHDAKFAGIYLGFYRVRISKMVDGKETLPARYNTETELGYEASDDIPNVSNIIQFALKSR